MPVFANLNCFNAGELSPKMLGRNDVSQYSKGCRELRNFLVTPYGAVERRKGTRYIATSARTNSRVRLIPFVISSTVAYVCEFGNNYIRFFRDGEPVANDGTPVEISTPYAADKLDLLKFVQSADVMTIVHPDHAPRELRRTGEKSFTLTEKTFVHPPMLDPNLDDAATIEPSNVTGNITLTASKDVFTADNAGGYFELIHTRRSNEISIDFTNNGVSSTLEVYGYWTFTTHGTWTGTLTIQRSFDGGTSWKDYRTYSSANDANTSTSGTEEDRDVLYRLKMDDYEASSTGTLKLCRCLFVNPDFVTTGVVRITSVTDTRSAAATVVQKLGGTDATNEWSEGAWSTRRGFPRAVAYFEERMVFGGTANNPNRVWGSKTGAWDNFLLGDKDDDALDFTLASDTVNTILWMCQHDDALIIGTIDSEWTLAASDRDAALTPSNFRAKRQSVYGTSDTQALIVGDTALFVQRGARKVREFVYSWEKDGYSCPDMTILADHITETGIVGCALQRVPDTLLWCVLANGKLACLTYEREQEIIGWHRHDTQGEVVSIAVIPDGDRDKLYLAVRRGENCVIEEMCEAGFWYLDSAIRVSDDDPFTAVGGLSHLEGQTVAILADGAVQRSKKVESGFVDLDTEATEAIVGLAYESFLSPMPVEIETQNGTTLLRNKIVGELRLRIYGSIGGEARAGSGKWQTIVSRDVLADDLDAAITPKSEIVRLVTAGGYESATTIEARQRDPLPLNVQTIVATYEIAE